MIYILGAFFSAFLIIILLHKKKTKSDFILIFWLLILGLDLFLFHYNNYNNTKNLFLLIINSFLPFLHGPFLFLYTKSLLNYVNRLSILILFLPFFLCLIFLFFYYFFISKNIPTEGKDFLFFEYIYYSLVLFTGFLAVFFSLKMVRKYEVISKYEFSNIEILNLKWLKVLIFGIGFTWISILFNSPKATLFILSFFVFCLGYYGIIKTPIFYKFQLQNGENTFIILKEKKTRKDFLNISLETENDIISKLDYLIENEVYLNPNFTQQFVAKKINTNTTYLSHVVNKYYHQSFSNYLNELRINYVIKEMKINSKYREYTTQAIAESAGFKNADSFTTSFKKKTGLTPFQFINEIKGNDK